MNSLDRILVMLVLAMPAVALAGSAVTKVSEPGPISLLAAGGIALALYGKFRKK
jgi:hypothetical protein